MNTKIIAAAVLGTLTCVAHAQSSVTLDGSVDGGVRYTNNTKGSVTTMNSNGLLTSNRLDFIGKEDLGSGWNAHFMLEGGFNLGTGAFDNTNGLIFNRMSYVGLSGPYGSLDLGRQYTLAHDIVHDFDPFTFQYPGILPLTPATDGTRFNNDIKYKKEFGPFDLSIENSLGGVAGNFNDGTSHGVGLQYKAGFFNVGGTFIHRTVLTGAVSVYQPDNYFAVGTELKFGGLRVTGGYMNENVLASGVAPANRTENYWAGSTYDVNYATRIGFGIYETNVPTIHGKRDQGILSVVYSLSKRTRLYAETDYIKYRGGYITSKTLNPFGAKHQIAASVGINHTF